MAFIFSFALQRGILSEPMFTERSSWRTKPGMEALTLALWLHLSLLPGALGSGLQHSSSTFTLTSVLTAERNDYFVFEQGQPLMLWE